MLSVFRALYLRARVCVSEYLYFVYPIQQEIIQCGVEDLMLTMAIGAVQIPL